jgi:hypothetical protein
VPTPVTDGKYFYVADDRGVMYCLDAKTGEKIWGPQRIKNGTYSSSPILADRRSYAVTSEDGLTTVLQAGPEFKVLAENSLMTTHRARRRSQMVRYSSRTAQNLYCIGEANCKIGAKDQLEDSQESTEDTKWF